MHKNSGFLGKIRDKSVKIRIFLDVKARNPRFFPRKQAKICGLARVGARLDRVGARLSVRFVGGGVVVQSFSSTNERERTSGSRNVKNAAGDREKKRKS